MASNFSTIRQIHNAGKRPLSSRYQHESSNPYSSSAHTSRRTDSQYSSNLREHSYEQRSCHLICVRALTRPRAADAQIQPIRLSGTSRISRCLILVQHPVRLCRLQIGRLSGFFVFFCSRCLLHHSTIPSLIIADILSVRHKQFPKNGSLF
jgi:hypothetical protein